MAPLEQVGRRAWSGGLSMAAALGPGDRLWGELVSRGQTAFFRFSLGFPPPQRKTEKEVWPHETRGDIGSVIDNTTVKTAMSNLSYNSQFQSFFYNKRIACNLQSVHIQPEDHISLRQESLVYLISAWRSIN